MSDSILRLRVDDQTGGRPAAVLDCYGYEGSKRSSVLLIGAEPKRLQLLPRRDSGIQIHLGATRLPGRVAAPGGDMGLPGLAFNSA